MLKSKLEVVEICTLGLDETAKSGKEIAEIKEDSGGGTTAMAIWTEDIVLDPGNVRFPIRVALVDNNFQTRFDRFVQLPKGSTTYIYRVLDHGIPWQHLDAGLTIQEVRRQIMSLCRGKDLVMYDAWKTVGLFDFNEAEMLQLNIWDLKTNSKCLGPKGQQLSYWNLVRDKLNHTYSGKPGNYDTLQLTDFVMSIYQRIKDEEETPKG